MSTISTSPRTLLRLKVGSSLAIIACLSACATPSNSSPRATPPSVQSGAESDPISIHLSYAEGFGSVAEMSKRAHLVAFGTVQAIVGRHLLDGKVPLTDFSIAIEQWIPAVKEVSSSIITVRQTGGTVNGVHYEVDDDPLFMPGDRVLLFLSEAEYEPGIYFVIAGPTGRFKVADDGNLTPMSAPLKDSPTSLDSMLAHAAISAQTSVQKQD